MEIDAGGSDSIGYVERWTKNAKVIAVEYPSAIISDGGSSSSSLLSRHGMLAHRSSLLVDDASLTDARTSYLMEEFARVHVNVKALDDGGIIGLTRSRNKNTEERITIHDPSFVRAKGCGKRLKSSKEKAMAKSSRQCSACGQNGHDKRTCPTSTRETYQPDMNDQVQTQDEGRFDATFMSYAIWNVTNRKWVHSAVVNSGSLRKWVDNFSGAQSPPAFAEHDIRAVRLGCDHISTKGTPFITPGRCAPPKPSPTPVQFPADESGTGSRDARKWGLKIVANSSKRTEEEMAASGGLWQRAGGRRLMVAAVVGEEKRRWAMAI
ncbi:Protein FAR1-RELATED SEQUENCE [Forsythia ovata]|uniref:Protein FAR1-RELATED SEQUENCE n=1 Tax=Forsythia ovata TaxID=205694 RepID=A0ABD1X8P3_9LAMI